MNETGASPENGFKRFIPDNPWHLLWLAVISSVILTTGISSLLCVVFWKQISSEVLIISLVDSLLVSATVSCVIIYLIQKIRISKHQNVRLLEEIGKRRAIEASLQESEKKHKEVINLLPLALFETDEEGDIIYANKYFSELFQYTTEDFAYRLNLLDLIKGAEAKQKASEHLEAQPSSSPAPMEQVVAKKNGELVPVSIYCYPIFGDNEQCGIRGVIVDLTEQKKREDDLVRIEKLESIGMLTGGLAHKFNNLLAVIQGNVSLAQLKLTDNTVVGRYLATAEQACNKAYQLARQLHFFSHEGKPEMKLVDISRLIQESASFTFHGTNIEGDISLPDDLWAVHIDENQFINFFNNIFINAGQAMPQGGTVTVRGTNAVLERNNEMHLNPGNYLHITIADNGVGIPRSHFKKIFDPFFTTKQKGSGLGLSACFSIINQHKGYITVESEPGIGTTFHIYLHANDRERPAKPQLLKDGFFIIGKKVLLMDDQEDIRQLGYNMLKEVGCEVSVAKTGYEAVELYQDALNHEKPYDIVILDLILPGGMGGEETLRVLKAMDPGVTAIVSSGCSYDPVLADYMHYGFSGIIYKPYTVQKMSMTLYSVLRRKKFESVEFPSNPDNFALTQPGLTVSTRNGRSK